MAMSHQILLFTFCSLLLLVIVVQCQGYPLLNELPMLERGHKFHSQHDVDRYLNRMKQYYATMAQLRLWRRDVDPWMDQDDSEEFIDAYEILKKRR